MFLGEKVKATIGSMNWFLTFATETLNVFQLEDKRKSETKCEGRFLGGPYALERQLDTGELMTRFSKRTSKANQARWGGGKLGRPITSMWHLRLCLLASSQVCNFTTSYLAGWGGENLEDWSASHVHPPHIADLQSARPHLWELCKRFTTEISAFMVAVSPEIANFTI